jgi:hypothetical protein
MSKKRYQQAKTDTGNERLSHPSLSPKASMGENHQCITMCYICDESQKATPGPTINNNKMRKKTITGIEKYKWSFAYSFLKKALSIFQIATNSEKNTATIGAMRQYL